MLIETGRIGEAAALLGPAYERLVEKYGSDSVRTSIAAVTLAQLRQAEGNMAAANSLALGAISVLDAEGTRQRHAIELA
ncbi:hypothetical protein [Dokdonella sp.]|uniref:hypothetical protein n=1 Tax=Dokdonella sp. TaxID=2291710 RepID=UPI0035287B0B